MSRALPALVAHADWSSDPRKRWMSVAHRHSDSYELSQPEPVGEAGSLFSRLAERADGGSIVIGADFPIGLPAAYAKAAGIERFLDVLPLFGMGLWSRFYDIARTPTEITVRRPFYPLRSNSGSTHLHLTSGLGVSTIRDLLRECERRHEERHAACSVFWTLGGQQVGRAAIVGWRDLLAPALRAAPHGLGLWPFHGSLDSLLNEGHCIVVETYPAEACIHLGFTPPGKGWSKRKQSDRQRKGPLLLTWTSRRGMALSKSLKAAVLDGFGSSEGGEDPFDSVLGLMSMLEVLLGHRPDGAPTTQAVREVEGWIFGQTIS